MTGQKEKVRRTPRAKKVPMRPRKKEGGMADVVECRRRTTATMSESYSSSSSSSTTASASAAADVEKPVGRPTMRNQVEDRHRQRRAMTLTAPWLPLAAASWPSARSLLRAIWRPEEASKARRMDQKMFEKGGENVPDKPPSMHSSLGDKSSEETRFR